MLECLPSIQAKSFSIQSSSDDHEQELELCTFSQFWDGLNSNFYIEDFSLEDRHFAEKFPHLIHRANYHCDLNRGGRRALKEEDFNPSLWPFVLARASRIHRYNSCDSQDVIFHLVRLGLPACLSERGNNGEA